MTQFETHLTHLIDNCTREITLYMVTRRFVNCLRLCMFWSDCMLITFPVEYGGYITYLNDWQDVIEKGTGFPLHVMYYEDMKIVRIGVSL